MKDEVWAYLVVSSAQQAETLPDQRQWAEETAEAHGWRITERFEDVSSGIDGTRKLLANLIARLERIPKAQRPERVLMIRLDRVGRGDGLDAIATLAKIYKLGVKIFTRQDGDVTITNASSAINPMIRLLVGAIENESRRDKLTAHYDKLRAQGRAFIGYRAAYGLRLENDGTLSVFEPEAEVVRRVFELRIAGHGYMTIGVIMASSGAPPRTKQDGTTEALRWDDCSVRYWIRNKNYRGTVVTEDVWDQANAITNRGFNKDNTVYAWRLNGGIKCECGRSMSGRPSRCNWKHRLKVHSYVYRYYVCPDPIAHDGHVPRFNADKLEAQIPELLRALPNHDEGEQAYAERMNGTRRDLLQRQREASAQLATLDGRRDHAWDQSAAGAIPDDEFRRRLAALGAEEQDLRHGLEQAQRDLDALYDTEGNEQRLSDLAGALADQWDKVPWREQRAVARALSRLVGGITVLRGTKKGEGVLRPLCNPQENRLDR